MSLFISYSLMLKGLTVLLNNMQWQQGYIQIEAFPAEISGSLYQLLHVDIYHDMATQYYNYLSLCIFCDMTGIYTSVHLHSLLHVVSIVIQQSLKSHSQLSYEVDTYFSQHFCCNTHIQNLL